MQSEIHEWSISSSAADLASFLSDFLRNTALLVWHNNTFYVTIVILTLVFATYRPSQAAVDAPVVTTGWFWEPPFFARVRFLLGASSIIKNGYVKYGDRACIVRRLDNDVVILSHKYLDELKSLPSSVMSAAASLATAMGGKYTGFDVVAKTDLCTRALWHATNANLARFHMPLKEELDSALRDVINADDEWSTIDSGFDALIREAIVRMGARILVGPDLGRKNEWISLALNYTIKCFAVSFFVRFVPWILEPFTSFILLFNPAWHSLRKDLARSRTLLKPVIKSCRENSNTGKEMQEPPTVLQWMLANPRSEFEASDDTVTGLQVLLSMASNHTMVHTVSFFIYDCCSYPQYLDELRSEAEECLAESGCWDKDTLDKMRKIDSFLCESQRLNPSVLLTINREVKKPFTFSDGLHLPQGTRIAMAARDITFDPNIVPQPELFDPWRNLRAREKPKNEMKHRFGTPSSTMLAWGNGPQACPGRQIAAVIVKMCVAALLIGWDIRFAPGHTRPAILAVDEFFVSVPGARTMQMRKRQVRSGVPTIGQ